MGLGLLVNRSEDTLELATWKITSGQQRIEAILEATSIELLCKTRNRKS